MVSRLYKKELLMKASSPALCHLHFPGESVEYRGARNALLAEEMELRRQIERVAAQRRALPAGGAIPEEDSVLFRHRQAGGRKKKET